MKYKSIISEDTGTRIELTRFSTGNVDEIHALIHVEPRNELFVRQLERIRKAESSLATMEETRGAQIVFKRYFLSDAANQAPLVREESDCATSCIQQPPLDGSKIAVWIYLQRGTEICHTNACVVASHNGYRHIWTMGLCDTSSDTSYSQTENTLLAYTAILRHSQATLADHCVRTWFYVRDVDTQYAGLVKARRECFEKQGLTTATHFIASTGIGGTPANPASLVQMCAYAVTGFAPEQQRYLYAPTHLNRTSDYGVTFERATLMQYGDRNHIYISGTASIDNKGEVMYVGDIVRQTQRMWENVEKLLEEGGMSNNDVMQMLVYLRDGADYPIVKQLFEEKYPHIPILITLAPVCRPTWLIEMECIAVKETCNDYPDF